MQFDTPAFMRSAPAATTMQFESEPAGAEARTSLGQSCRTPCSVAVTANDFTVSFTLPGYQPQTVPVRVTTPEGGEGEARLVPNPVFAELLPAGPPPPIKKPPPPKKRKPKPVAAHPAPTAMAPEPAPSPAPAPASPWPPAR
jgi:hypothetical protein